MAMAQLLRQRWSAKTAASTALSRKPDQAAGLTPPPDPISNFQGTNPGLSYFSKLCPAQVIFLFKFAQVQGIGHEHGFSFCSTSHTCMGIDINNKVQHPIVVQVSQGIVNHSAFDTRCFPL